MGKDVATDLAVVKIEPKAELAFATLGDSDKAHVGDWAIAIGSPFGLEQTVTVGVISAVRQSLRVEDRVYSDFLQTDAAINQGNSGGPLLNVSGEVIGINTAIYGPAGAFAGVGFAIPSKQVKGVVKQLVEEGRVVRGWLGAELMPLDEVLAKQFGAPGKKGALVNRVFEGSPAGKAGLRRGDIIVEFNGKAIDSPEDLTKAVGETPPKAHVSLKALRDGKALQLSLVTGERPSETALARDGAEPEQGQEDKARPFAWMGAELLSANDSLNRKFGLAPDDKGALVVRVEDGPAAEMGLAPGDLIVSINRKEVSDVPGLLQAAKGADLKQGIMLDINRKGRPIYLSFRSAEG